MSLDDRIEYLRKKGLEKKASSVWHKKWWGRLLIVVMIIILSVVMSFVFLFFRFLNNPLELNKANLDRLNEEELLASIKDDQSNIKMVEGPAKHFLGSDEPEATIVLFSDIACPFSKQAVETIRSLEVIYGDRVKIIVRDFPIIREDSLDLAMVSRCAGEQGKYWEMYFKLFELQDQIPDLGIGHIVSSVGIDDPDSFYNCVDNQKYLNEISKDFSDAQFLQVEGVPAWFLDANKIAEGNIPLEAWRGFLDEYLSAKESF